MTYSINNYRLVALAARVGLGSTFAACSSDSTNVKPSDLGDGTGGKTSTGGATSSGGKTSNGGGGATNTSGGAGNTKDGGTGGAATDGGGGAGGGTHPTGDSGQCTEDNTTSCLECPNIPTNDKEFMNHCTTGCIKFTTTSTVPAKADLPAIP